MAVSRASFGNGSNEVFIFCSAPEWTKATGLMPRRLASWAWLLRWPLWFLQHADRVVSPTREAVAQKIIELAKAGERDPGRLCDATLEALGTSFRSAPVISDFARVPAYSSSELISGRPSDARALAKHQRVLPLSARAPLPLSQNSTGNSEATMKLAVEPHAVEEPAVDLRGL